MACPHGQGELNQCEHFADKGGGVNFFRFYADVFYGRPLIVGKIIFPFCNSNDELHSATTSILHHAYQYPVMNV